MKTLLNSIVKPQDAHPKVREIVPKSLEKFVQQFTGGGLLEARFTIGSEKLWFTLVGASVSAYTSLLEDEEFLGWYETSEFDLVFIDSFFSEFAYAIAYKNRATFAFISTTAPYSWQYDALGIPVEHSWLPDMQWHYPEDMSLYYRIMNTYRTLEWLFFRWYSYYPQLEKLFKDRLGLKDMPGFLEFEKNASLVLANTHYAEEYGRSLPPFVIPVGGMHCFESKDSTPKDLEMFMNNSGSTGFILVSFGSAAQITGMRDSLKAIFFESMRKANTNFLIKWDDEIPSTMPPNVYTASWLPQQNILAHPNIKGFITHGGLLGIHEAICSGVPLIVAPVFAEQEYNGNRIHSRRRGIKIELTTLTQEELDNAIANLLTDPSYKKNMEEASRLFLDRPQKPLDAAVWWTEFILRHGPLSLS
ncbi:unnamed protein product [Allacma fusca]|uniref:UDP-glucuronosyltransferase n=1 Tax=Allacma fusca TaxID=39272 RepID=A0A8J2P1I3_9HEXA|nr:unnamed protein product [Allacma fusca]